MYLIIKSIVFLMLLSIIKGEIGNKVEISATCDEIEQRKAELDDNYYTFEFRITSATGDYWQSREECLNMGGDLLMHNFGEEGAKYFSEIRALVQNTGTNLWIGANDIGLEGTFRILNGTRFEPSNYTLYDWKSGEPNNNDEEEHCVCIVEGLDILNDLPCDAVESSNEIPMRGLCEVKRYQNCIVKFL